VETTRTTPPNKYAIEAGIWKGKPEDWDGSYFPALGQEIVEADAEELASALESEPCQISLTLQGRSRRIESNKALQSGSRTCRVAASTVSKRSQVRARRC
jgi:hypothetical protein